MLRDRITAKCPYATKLLIRWTKADTLGSTTIHTLSTAL
jgi:hypothetical protein